jgi:hypothetical protein
MDEKKLSWRARIRGPTARGDYTVLTDTALKNLRPKARAYKSTDRDGMYVYVSTGGRYDYRFNGRRETMTLGRYGRAGLTLGRAYTPVLAVSEVSAPRFDPKF